MRNDFKLGKEAQKELSTALSTIAAAIGSTLGPGGMPFGFDRFDPAGRLDSSQSKDGFTVLRALRFDDKPAWHAVLQYCRQASASSVLESGDGSTSSIIIADAVCRAILNANEKYPQAFARVIEADAERAIQEIRKEAITGDDILKKVAMTSSNSDEELSDVVIEAVKTSSAYGSILVNKRPESKARYRIVRQDGYSYCSGYEYNQPFALSADPNVASNRPMEWSDAAVLTFNGHLVVMSQIQPIISQFAQLMNTTNKRKLVIVAYEVSDDVCNALMVLNRKNAHLGASVFVVRPKLTAEINSSVNILRDIAAFCGIQDSKIVDGGNLSMLDTTYFGECGKVQITNSNTTFMGRAKSHWVDTRILQNSSIVEFAKTQFDVEFPKIRNAELAEGLVTVEIGGGLAPDLQERADRFDDASKAVKAAIVSGALPGAGFSYIRAGNLANVHPALKEAFRAVHETLMNNFGHDARFSDPEKGMTLRIGTDNSVVHMNAFDANVLDACETVSSVIRNGVALGVKIATMGGYLFRDPSTEHSV